MAKIYTIGHSTRPIQEFIDVLKKYQINLVVDIRSIPKSRHNPQYNRDKLKKSLKEAKIDYLHLEDLGGLRHAQKDSVNCGWKNASFRGYADWMQTNTFENALNELAELSKKNTLAIMCAEAVPWRCHRSLIADALLMRGIKVLEIIGEKIREHKITPFAKIEGNKVTYPC